MALVSVKGEISCRGCGDVLPVKQPVPEEDWEKLKEAFHSRHYSCGGQQQLPALGRVKGGAGA